MPDMNRSSVTKEDWNWEEGEEEEKQEEEEQEAGSKTHLPLKSFSDVVEYLL